MRSAALAIFLVGVMAVPLGAQGRGRGNRAQGIPPGQMPPPGQCRVWYDGVPPGRQPRPINCRDAERIAARDRSARVIYGANSSPRDDDRWGRPDYPYPNARQPRAIPRPAPSARRGGYAYSDVAFDNGYRDGYDKGREDARDNDSYDPVRHSRYRSADRGYNNRYGSKDDYKLVYRDGFEAGYDEGYRDNGGYTSRRQQQRGGWQLPWPF